MPEDKKDAFFPAIGDVADKTDKRNEEKQEDEERVTEEIESLCMKCGEQVRFSLSNSCAISHNFQ